MQKILDNERSNMLKRAEERLLILQNEAKKHYGEMEKYRQSLKLTSLNQQRIDFENKMREIRRENELKIIEEEKRLQDLILSIEQEKKV